MEPPEAFGYALRPARERLRPEPVALGPDDVLCQKRDLGKPVGVDPAIAHGATRLEHVVVVRDLLPRVTQQRHQAAPLDLGDPFGGPLDSADQIELRRNAAAGHTQQRENDRLPPVDAHGPSWG